MCDTVRRVDDIRHFTVTTFVSMDGATLLHWHRKVGLWLPPGGHIEPNEDPMQAACREALEETGFSVQILPTSTRFAYDDPPQLSPPATIMVEPIRSFGGEDAHHHVDMIYFSRPTNGDRPDPPGETWRWVDRQHLEDDAPMTLEGVSARISDDVRILGMAAIDHVSTFEETEA